ncbi:MAG TPA: methyltransferase domain-containing protein [Beijerinckiaceae bacterium]|jgi:predicted TPR repeat methyltransferase
MALRSSGDLLADRRYAYAEAALAGGDAAAAADLAEQVLELQPRFAPAWFLLGRAREELSRGSTEAGLAEAARRAYAAALDLDPDDALGARLHLARLAGGDPLKAVTPAYVRALFDDYAPRFDRHLVEGLGYRGPALLAQALGRACADADRPVAFARTVDLGCGTGLMARALRDLGPEAAPSIEGVDLSPGMLAKARATGLYAALTEAELLAHLEGQPEASADLVIAADVFVYLGDLAPPLAASRRVLKSDGLLAFTVQTHSGEGVVLGEDARYAHAEAYIRAAAVGAGLKVALLEPASTRRDRGTDVPGLIVVLAPRGASDDAGG